MALGIILAGGKGSRFGDPFKCLRPVGGVPMLLRVAAALQPFVDTLAVATTKSHGPVVWLARLWGLDVIYTSGLGYEHDFSELVGYAPAVLAACDIPFLSPSHIARLMSEPLMASAVGARGHIGVTWLPNADTAKWVDVYLPELDDVDVRDDLVRLDREGPTYPIVVEPSSLLPHEDVEAALTLGPRIRPIVVDAWTCTVLDGHHRLRALMERGLPAPVVPMDYSRIEVKSGGLDISKLYVVSMASRGLRLGVRATRHYYGGRHLSELSHVDTDIGDLSKTRPLRCHPL